jgi:predicted nucleic acid-binding Zn ribbon protein
MPVYTYRREDGTTFDVRQGFHEAPLTHDPSNGQRVTRIVQSTGVIFKGSGFYVTDTRGASKSTTTPKKDTETKTEATPAAATTPKPAESAAD